MTEVSERDATFYEDGGWGYEEDAVKSHAEDMASLFTGRRILDAGCGDGAFTNAFANLGFDAVGVDVSEDAIATATRKYPNVEFHVLDLELPTELGLFDVIYCRGISHTGQPRSEESDMLFANLRTLLADGGRLILERLTDGTGQPGPSAFFPGQQRNNPTVGELMGLVSEWFTVSSIIQIADGYVLVCEAR